MQREPLGIAGFDVLARPVVMANIERLARLAAIPRAVDAHDRDRPHPPRVDQRSQDPSPYFGGLPVREHDRGQPVALAGTEAGWKDDRHPALLSEYLALHLEGLDEVKILVRFRRRGRIDPAPDLQLDHPRRAGTEERVTDERLRPVGPAKSQQPEIGIPDALHRHLEPPGERGLPFWVAVREVQHIAFEPHMLDSIADRVDDRPRFIRVGAPSCSNGVRHDSPDAALASPSPTRNAPAQDRPRRDRARTKGRE